jgi:hypothetical protein
VIDLKKETANLIIGIAMLMIAFATLMLKSSRWLARKGDGREPTWQSAPKRKEPRPLARPGLGSDL